MAGDAACASLFVQCAEPSLGIFRVINVASNDTLNLRKVANLRAKLVVHIPANDKCVHALGPAKKVGKRLWLNVDYGGAQGLVNSAYLKKHAECW